MRALKAKITQRVNPAGSTSWTVDAGMINGKRYRKFFATKAEAQTHAEQIKTVKINQGTAAFALSDRQRIEAAEAYRIIKPFGVTLLEAVNFYSRHAKPKGGLKLCKDAAGEFIGIKEKGGKKPRYIKAIRIALGIFNRTFGELPMNEVTRPKIETWLDGQEFALITRRNYLRDVGMLFTFGVNRGYCAENPLSLIERPTLDDKPPEILTLAQAEILLKTASENPQLALLPYTAIGLFAGLRSSELEALDWQEIKLAEKTIEVTGKKSKTRKRRLINVSENLAAWLADHVKTSGKIVPDDWRRRFQKLTNLAGFDRWPSNALRHSFASYHVAKHQNASLTALQLGHADTNMLFAHYRELVKPADAEKFWQIRPLLTAKNIIHLDGNLDQPEAKTI